MAWEMVEDQDSSQQSPLLEAGKETGRFLGRQAFNIGTRIAGTPGDLLQLVNEYIARPITAGLKTDENVPYQEITSPYEETPIGKLLPTTETQRQRLIQAYPSLGPQNEVEKFGDDVIEDTLALLTPGGAAKAGEKQVSRFIKKLAISTGANLAGTGIEQITGSKSAGAATKIGSLFLGSLLDKQKAAKAIGDLYKKAEAKLPAGASIETSNLNKKLQSLRTEISKNRPYSSLSDSEKFVMDQIEKVENLTKSNTIPVEQLWAQKRSNNEDLSKIYNIVGTRKEQIRAKKHAGKITNFLNESIGEYGRKNPEFYKPFKEADEAFGVIAQSNILSRTVGKILQKAPLSKGLLHLFGAPISAGATALSQAFIPYHAGKILYRMKKSPALRKLYGESIKAALQENAPAFNKYLNEMDRQLQEDENEEKWEFID